MSVGQRWRTRAADESGVTLVMAALFMVVLMIVLGLVLEFGQVRTDRQANKSSADFAVLSGMQHIAHDTSPGTPRPWLGVCAALRSLQADDDRFTGLSATYTDGAGTPVPGNPCTLALPVACAPNAPATWAWYRGVSSDGRVRLEIRSGYRLPDPAFSADTVSGYAGDNGSEGGCDNFAVIVDQARERGFSGVTGDSDLRSRIRSVGRFQIDGDNERVAALLLLERTRCGALQSSGQGAVVIQPSAPNNPGIIHADSAGVVGPGGCTTNTNAGGFVIYGTALPSGAPTFTVEPTSTGIPGIIQTHSIETGGRGAHVYPGGLNVAPTGGPVISRAPADRRYNPTTRPAISDLHAAARLATTVASPPGWLTISGASCTGLSGSFPLVGSVPGIVVDCATFSPDNVVLNAPEIRFKGRIDIANNKVLTLTAPQRVYVRGCAAPSCAGSPAIAVAGTLNVNASNPVVPCSLRTAAVNTNTTVLATLGGPVTVNGLARLCQTTLYVGTATSSYAAQSVTSGGGCTDGLPCPKLTGAGDGYFRVQGGQGQVDWSAPDQLSARPVGAQLLAHPFEDLALWAESAELSVVKGTGTNRSEGVFFTPNATFEFTGQGSQAQPLNAQFFTRTLDLKGQGTLYLRPDPNDAVSTPVLSGFALVR